MSPDVELAMGLIQLTGVLIPLLLGITRYYVNQEMVKENPSDMETTVYVLILFTTLLFAYYAAFLIIQTHGNYHLITAVVAYGAFLTLLFAGIPYILGKKWLAYIYSGGGVMLLLIVFFRTAVVTVRILPI